MNYRQEKFDEEELNEAIRFDRQVTSLYQNDSDLIVEPEHWEKFNTQEKIPHPYAFIIQSIGDLTGKRILEVGCGTGIFSIILVKRGAKFVESFDISEKSILIAKKRAAINGVKEKINFHAKSIYDIEYSENSFDFIIGLNVLHHVEIEKIIDKIYFPLKPDGFAFFLEPFGNVRWLERLRLLIPVKVNEEDKSHWQEKLNYKNVEKLKSRFNHVECIEFHLFSRLDRVFCNKTLLDMISKIDKLLLRLPFLRKYARKIVLKLKK